MKLAQIAVVAAALFGGANAAGPRNGFLDGDERGIDCGGSGQDPCTCWTDKVRADQAVGGFQPPTLINDNTDRSSSTSDRETGLITYNHDVATDADGTGTPDKTFLEVVIDLDASVYTEADTHVTGTNAPVFTSGKTVAGTYLSEHTDGFVETDRYANPHVFFVDASNNVMNGCRFNTAGEAPATDSTADSNPGALFVERPSTSASDQYGTNGDNCINSGFTTYLRTEFKPALGDCGFESEVRAADNIDGHDTSEASAVNAAIVGNSYTRYLGRVKIETTRQNGELRGEENVLREEYAFQISILFPNTLTVTSSPVSIIGEATHEAALTHQIYDSANENLNLNMIIGTTFPYAVTTLDTAAPTKDDTVSGDIASLKLDADTTKTPFIAGATLAQIGSADWNNHCDPGNSAITRGQAYYNNIICDHDDSKSITLGDFVQIVNEGDATYTYGPSGPADADHFGVATPGGTALPAERCIGENTSPADEDAQACLQNTFMRLKPRASYCDFNLGLTLTVNAVCRDDYNGDGTNDDSLQSTFWGGSASAGVADWPITSANTLFNPDGSVLNCDSAEYRANIEAQEALSFQLASDDFCPRVIATGALNTPEMSIYESSFGESTWGAHGYADATAAAAAVDETINSAACTTGAHSAVGGQTLCLQVPGYTTESKTPTADQRKLQDEFVFGTTSYIETRIAVSSGVNIDSTEITDLWVARSERTDSTPRDTDTEFPSGATADVAAANGLWQKQVITGSAVVASGQTYTAADASTVTSMVPFVTLSNNIVTDSLIIQSDGSTTNAFFTTNPALTGTEAAKLGNAFEGVSRATVQMNKYTVLITDQFGEAPEPIAFYANIAITYKAANQQAALGQKRTVKGQAQLPAGAANRARSLAAPAVTGGQASANAGVRANAATGSAGGASTIAGFSSTTVLAAAAVLGAVVVAAGASFFVVRKRRQAAAKTAKRSSSSTELNDTAQVQV